MIRQFLNAYWLRPEQALWFFIAARHVAPALAGKPGILEIGIGDGTTSFITLGGKLSPRFDVFQNANTDGFWNNVDIYDHDAGVTPEIEKPPNTRISVAIDHKQNLLNKAARLGFVDKLICHDCNEPIEISATTGYSNILYWLRDPIAALHSFDMEEFVCVFPNSDFFKFCSSYSATDPLGKAINRGRADSVSWHMDLPDFEREIQRRGRLEVAEAATYLSERTLKFWDVGFRPMSVPLIKMANALSPSSRAEIKSEWCDTLMRFAEPMLESESGPGGFNFVRLINKRR